MICTNIGHLSSNPVSKETRELQLFWSSSHTPVTVAADLQMPQFSIQKVKPTTCNNQFHLGK